MMAKREPQTITDPFEGRAVLTGGSFRTDHPFRATRQVFGASVLDVEGAPHMQRKRAWLKQFDRHWIASVESQTIVETAVMAGFDHAYLANDIFLACEYIPNKVILDLLDIEDVVDPIKHFQRVRPVIEYLETMTKLPELPAARDYLRCLASQAKTTLFAELSPEERYNELMLFAVAGSETTIVALKSIVIFWATDELRFRLDVEKQSVEGFVSSLLRSDPPLGLATRYCSQDTKVGARSIQRGDIVHVSIIDTNSASETSSEVDSHQIAGRELTFGAGRHHCPGHLLAKAELHAFTNKLLTLKTADFNIILPSQGDRPKTFRHPRDIVICPRYQSTG